MICFLKRPKPKMPATALLKFEQEEVPVVQKKWTKAEINEKIISDQRWLERAILAVYNFQTREEKDREATVEDNGVGFNAFDAPYLSSLAEWLTDGRRLTDKQAAVARPIMLKYTWQLAKIANCS